jgi:hypothetical protein
MACNRCMSSCSSTASAHTNRDNSFTSKCSSCSSTCSATTRWRVRLERETRVGCCGRAGESLGVGSSSRVWKAHPLAACGVATSCCFPTALETDRLGWVWGTPYSVARRTAWRRRRRRAAAAVKPTPRRQSPGAACGTGSARARSCQMLPFFRRCSPRPVLIPKQLGLGFNKTWQQQLWILKRCVSFIEA